MSASFEVPAGARSLSQDGRFYGQPHHKRADRYDARNSSGMVRDGWTVTDQLLGYVGHVDTLAEGRKIAANTARVEQESPWDQISAWRCDTTPSWPGQVVSEVEGVDSQGRRVGTIAVVVLDHGSSDGDAAAAARIAAWLNHLGRGDLPRTR